MASGIVRNWNDYVGGIVFLFFLLWRFVGKLYWVDYNTGFACCGKRVSGQENGIYKIF